MTNGKHDEASAPEGARVHQAFTEILRGMCDPQALERAQNAPVMVMVSRDKLFALQAAYEKAMLDPHVRIPSYLHCAIAALK